MTRGCLRPAVAGALLLCMAGDVRAGKKDPMNIEDGVLDEIHLKVASIPGAVPVLIRPFSTEGVDLGTGGENAKKEERTEAATAVARIGPGMLVEAFGATVVESGTFKEILPANTKEIPEKTLVVEGRFLRIDPGSRAKRYWAGFGAGKSTVQVTGVVKDASGNELAEFTHMRHSGIGLGGGDYVKFLSDDTKDVGRDIARFLVRWASGEDLHKD